jgi:hypothetical protein
LFNGKNSISNVFSVIAGSDIFVLGRLTPLDFNSPPCITLAITSVFLSVSTISKISFPSNKILSPVFTSFGKFYIS